MSELALLVVVGLPLLALMVYALVEVVRRRDLGGGRKAVWVVALLAIPVIGLGVYVVARPPRAVRVSGGSPDTAVAESVVVTAERRQRGELTDAEYDAEIARTARVS